MGNIYVEFSRFVEKYAELIDEFYSLIGKKRIYEFEGLRIILDVDAKEDEDLIVGVFTGKGEPLYLSSRVYDGARVLGLKLPNGLCNPDYLVSLLNDWSRKMSEKVSFGD